MIFSAWWKFQIEILWGGKITSFGERERERDYGTRTLARVQVKAMKLQSEREQFQAVMNDVSGCSGVWSLKLVCTRLV
jgi:3-dehydroquinate dehydratase